MPEPLLYMQAMGIAAVVSSLCVLALAQWGVPPPDHGGTEGGRSLSEVYPNQLTARLDLASTLALATGFAVSGIIVRWRFVWPPVNGFDRFVTIVVPTALVIELTKGFQFVRPVIAWGLRMILAAATPRILLHDSMYLGGYNNGWTVWQTGAVLTTCGVLLAGAWVLLAFLSHRSLSGVSIAGALCLAIFCTGLTVMMGGYIKGGAAAFPLAASLMATAIAARLIAPRLAPAIIALGVVQLFCLAFIGHFYGRLSTGRALVTLLAPLLCWVTEVPVFRRRSPWLVGPLRLVLVAIPLFAVLVLAKREFDRTLLPLLETASVNSD
jgi:hypothetical protein